MKSDAAFEGDRVLSDALQRARILAIVRYRTVSDLPAVFDALVRGGVTAVEVTIDTPGALAAVSETARRSDLCLGVGTVTTASQVRQVAEAGGRFVVSPGLIPEVVIAAHRNGLSALPGVMTGTEIIAAERVGARLLKLFPAASLGPEYLAALRGPFVDAAFVPTGGVRADEIPSWLRAGAWAVALGSDLVGRTAPSTQEELTAITQRATEIVNLVAKETP